MMFHFSQSKKRKRIPSSLWLYAGTYPVEIVGLILLSVALSLFSLALPLLVARTIDGYSLNQTAVLWHDSRLVILITLVFLIGLSSLLLTFFSAWVSEKIAFDLRYALIERLGQQSVSFVDNQSPARLLTRLTSDVEAVKKFVNGGLVSVFNALFMLGGSLFMLFSLSAPLTWLISSCVPILIAVTGFVIFHLRKLFAKNQENLEHLNAHIGQTVRAASLVRVLNAKYRQIKDFLILNQRAWRLAVTIVSNFAILVPLISAVMNGMILLVLWFGAQEVMSGQLSVGEFSAFFGYTSLILLPIFTLSAAVGVITQSFVSFARIIQILKAPLLKQGGEHKGVVLGNYVLQNVRVFLGFEEKKEILKDINAYIPRVRHVAIVGPVGAGKTQLFNLLTGLSEPSSGEVLLDGISLKKWQRHYFTQQIGMVFQDSVLFSGTWRTNLGGQELREESVEKALRTAQLWDYVSNLPEGLDTPLSERAQDLSGGQRQRLMLARALVNEPRLLFLDDFVARLDIKTAHEVVKALKESYPNTVIFEIAQDLKVAQQVDWVLLMMEGELLAQGTHKDLLASSWEYRELLSSSQGIEDEGL